MKIRVLIVEDETPVQRRCSALVEQHEELELIGIVRDTATAASLLKQNDVDALIICVGAEREGLHFLEQLDRLPLVVALSKDPEDAVKCFEIGVLDMVLKPFEDARFNEALSRTVEAFQFQGPADPHGSLFGRNSARSISIRHGRRMIRVDLGLLRLVESSGNQVMLHLDDKLLKVGATLKRIEELLPEKDFTRIHRMYLLADRVVNDIDHGSVYTIMGEFPIGATYRKVVRQKFEHLLKE